MGIYYVDGEFVDERDALIPTTDLAVLRGYGVFDFTRTYRGIPFKLAEHIARLRRSAEHIDLPLPFSDDEIADVVMQTVKRNSYPESNVRIVVTGGNSLDGIMPLDTPRLLVLVTPLRVIDPRQYLEGIKVITERVERYIPEAKTLNYIPAIKALRRAAKVNAVEAIYVDRAGNALEGTTTNLFAFFGETLVTPEASILNGITRGVVLQLAEPHFRVVQRPLKIVELLSADEVFISSSNKQVMPVVAVDDSIIASGKPGVRTRKLMGLFGALTGEPIPGALEPERA